MVYPHVEYLGLAYQDSSRADGLTARELDGQTGDRIAASQNRRLLVARVGLGATGDCRVSFPD